MWQCEFLLNRALNATGVGGLLPDGRALLAGPTGAFVRHAGGRRVEQWFALRKRAFDYFIRENLLVNVQPYVDFVAAGELVQQVLSTSGRGYLWLKDAAIDTDPGASVQLGNQTPRLRDLIEEVHSLLHRSGEIHGGLYGCALTHDDGKWFQECLVHLPHIPLANSIGFTCRYICAVCGEDASICCHVRGQTYEVVVVKDTRGTCSICRVLDKGCEHADGERLNVQASVMITDVELREVSLVKRARDPLARITSIEKEAAELSALLGRTPRAGELVLCHTCMHPCQHQHAHLSDG